MGTYAKAPARGLFIFVNGQVRGDSGGGAGPDPS